VRARLTRLVAALGAAATLACSEPREAPPPEPAPTSTDPPTPSVDPARGRARMAELECSRCHALPDAPDPPPERDCVGCHRSIRAGTYDAPPARLRRWQHAVRGLEDAPSLVGLGARLRRDWIERYLLAPHEVRPGLRAEMPRLPIAAEDAAAIALALTEGAPTEGAETATAEVGDPSAGLALLREHGCPSCHAFTGALDTTPSATGSAAQLAPDLRHTRARMTRAMLLRWLRAPAEVLPGTSMPTPTLTEVERERVADAVLALPLAASPPPRVPERLPILARPVRHAEVAERVFRRSCWHCHADPDLARGDGGAGNTGGFGYAPRGVVLADYAGVASGYLDAHGERRSLFALDEDGTPHLVRVLMARHFEVAGQPLPDVTGMPLGLPPLPLEDIQLVETWIAQGRPE
jgi:cytochrome c2